MINMEQLQKELKVQMADQMQSYLALLLVVLVVCAVLSNRCDYVFDTNDADFGNKPDWQLAEEKVSRTSGRKIPSPSWSPGAAMKRGEDPPGGG